MIDAAVPDGSTISPRRSCGSAGVVGGYRRHIRQQASYAIILRSVDDGVDLSIFFFMLARESR